MPLLGELPVAKLVFIDETGTATNMARLRGRCPRGKRLIGRVPHGHWKTTTFVAALRADGIAAPFVIDRAMNGDIFRAYVEQCLVPTLSPGDVVITDNLGTHKVGRVREAIERAGASVLYLPPYSPDPNPIEQAFASSRTGCERPLPGRSRTCGTGSANSSTPSRRRNAGTTSNMHNMHLIKLKRF